MSQVDWSKLSLEQLVEWAAGYILVAVGRGDFRQAVNTMIRQAYANGYNARARERARPARTAATPAARVQRRRKRRRAA